MDIDKPTHSALRALTWSLFLVFLFLCGTACQLHAEEKKTFVNERSSADRSTQTDQNQHDPGRVKVYDSSRGFGARASYGSTVASSELASVPLNYYVYKSLEPAAQLIIDGKYQKALILLNTKSQTSSAAEGERHYLMALCLQSLKKFDRARHEYSIVEKHSKEPNLIKRAKEGSKLSLQRTSALSDRLLFLPQCTGMIVDPRMRLQNPIRRELAK